MDTENLFDEDTEREQDKRNLESRNKLDSYFNINPSAETDTDFLNNLEEEDVKIEDLRRLIDQLEEMKKEYEVPKAESDMQESQSQSESKGKVLTKSLKGFKNQEPEIDNTAKEIATSFINCFILCMVTAIMGAGWFLYIINHI